MIEECEIRKSLPTDISRIKKLYAGAFPDEELWPLVEELIKEGPGVASLVGFIGKALVAHALFATCSIAGLRDQIALLGPLAVAPDWQRKGIGSAMIHAGLQHLESTGTTQVCVLGDPAYYSRLGFTPDDQITPPYPLPEEWRGAWQSLNLSGEPLNGKLIVPQPWRKQALWVS